jgi:hypothetical protein
MRSSAVEPPRSKCLPPNTEVLRVRTAYHTSESR